MTPASRQIALSMRLRWRAAGGWLLACVLYGVAVQAASGTQVIWINNAAWTIASAVAALACMRTAQACSGPRRRTWGLLAAGCTCWFIGQLIWDYTELVRGEQVMFPGIAQLFFSAFAVFASVAVLQLPSPRQRRPFTFKKIGNIGLVSCCLAITIVLGVVSPALTTGIPALQLSALLIHTALVAATFLTCLYALWTYRWGVSWTPMLLLTSAASVYAVSNLAYAHAVLTETYARNDLVNGSWIVMFGLMALAATEQHRTRRMPFVAVGARLRTRERWLEAVVPALLITIMVLVAASTAEQMTARTIYITAGLFILFAIVLGAREAWIQKESQVLTAKLVAANEQLQGANHELRLSEARYRELNTELEQRVAERTAELKAAYEELEGFTYAVAHDLKAPLRAINGFAYLLEAELASGVSDTARAQLGRIRNGSVKMATLIDDLLAYSQIDRRNLQTTMVHLPELVDGVVSPYADEIQRRGVKMSVHAAPLSVHVDADGLSLALRNLFENALKYTREAATPRIDIQAARTERGVLLTFADNGIGFDMQYHDHIFKLFQRLHRDDTYPGTGIGLALVRKAVERMGGRVWAESAVQEGACFYIELPNSVLVTGQAELA